MKIACLIRHHKWVKQHQVVMDTDPPTMWLRWWCERCEAVKLEAKR